jgi:hypothetical protein
MTISQHSMPTEIVPMACRWCEPQYRFSPIQGAVPKLCNQPVDFCLTRSPSHSRLTACADPLGLKAHLGIGVREQYDTGSRNIAPRT